MRVLIPRVVKDSQHFVRDINRRALAGQAKNAFPKNFVGSFLHPTEDKPVASQVVQFYSDFHWLVSLVVV